MIRQNVHLKDRDEITFPKIRLKVNKKKGVKNETNTQI